MATFRTSKWSLEKIADCRKDLDEKFFKAVGKGEHSRMNPRAVDILNKDRVDVAETITRLIQEEVENINPLPLLVQEVTGDIRDNYIWQEMDGALRVVDRSYGSKPYSQRLTFKEYSIRTSMKETAVEIPLEEVFSGRFTPSMAASEMAIAIVRYRVATVLDTLDAAIPANPDRTGLSGYELRYSVGSALSAAVLDKAIDGLLDEGLNPTIIGRHIGLYPAIRNFSGWADGVSEELQRRGTIGTYHGANILTLRDPYAKRSQDHLIRKDKVWLASGTPGAIFMTKPVDFLNWTMVDPRTATFGAGIRLEDGLLVRDPYQYRIITITGI